jgi:hypothetical protein
MTSEQSELKIELINAPSEQQKDIIKDYWQREGNKFTFTPTAISNKYLLEAARHVTKIVKNHSQGIILDTYCQKCQAPIYSTIKVQSEYPKYRFSEFKRCQKCREKDDIQDQIEARKRAVRDSKRQDIIDDIDKNIFTEQESFDKAIECNSLELLSDDEKNILRLIIQVINLKKIFTHLKKHYGSYSKRAYWEKLDALQALGLIAMRRAENKSVTGIYFDDRMYELGGIKRPSPDEIVKDVKKLHQITTILDMKIDERSGVKLYEGSMILEEEIYFAKGTQLKFLAPYEKENIELRLMITETNQPERIGSNAFKYKK